MDDETKTDSGSESRPDVVFGPIYLEDDPLPDVLVSVRPDPNFSPELEIDCDEEDVKTVNW